MEPVGYTRCLEQRQDGEGRGWSRGAGGLGLIKQITSLVLIRKFQTNWLKILLLGEAVTTIKSVLLLS